MSKIQFLTPSDELKIMGPTKDKCYTIRITVPEFERQKLAPLLVLEDCNIKVTLEDE